MKKIFILCLAACMLFLVACGSATNEPTAKPTEPTAPSVDPDNLVEKDPVAGDFTWKVEGDTLTLSGTGSMPNYTEEEPAPWSTESENVKKVVIEEGLTSIGEHALAHMSKIEDVTIPGSVKVICTEAFSFAISLYEITIPSGVQAIEKGAFSGCLKLAKVNFSVDTGWYKGDKEQDVSDPLANASALTKKVGFYLYRK